VSATYEYPAEVVLARAEETRRLVAELDGAKRTIAHLTEAMSWVSGHDRTGQDHLEDAMRLASQLDAIRRAHGEYEAALGRREHGAVAADKFIRAVAAVLDEADVDDCPDATASSSPALPTADAKARVSSP
jgi:hypothetical protein